MLAKIWGQCPKVKVIDLFISNPQSEYTKTDMANYSGVARSTVYSILDDLEKSGIIKPTKKVGRSQLYQLDNKTQITKLMVAFESSLYDIELKKEASQEISEEDDFRIKYDVKKGEFVRYKVEKK